ncbi:hypothetical protein ACIRNI_23395 [Streptomyces sp. NPDC093546]|uniref:hypothetical protein n=1 Tax=Streptomyces sp. NPDC093546 TaxID=3366040 RepID=UPI00381AA4C6
MDEESRAAEVPVVRNEVSGGTASAIVQSGSIGTVHVGAAAPPDPFLWLPVRETDPVALGARHEGTYVERDRDAELAELSGLVVVTGEPLSGKTTTAWAAMVRALPDHQVCVPPPGADLRVLARHTGGPWVLWLDELEKHLHERGLDAGLLARLMSLGVPVVATMSDEAYDKNRFGSSAYARVLSRARTVELGLEWSEAELTRLWESDDPGHWFAFERRGRTGVTQYLGLGPDLWAEWQRAQRPANHPRGHRLVRAAIDLDRCGIRGPLPVELLREVHELYDADAASGESFEDALAWAARPRLGVTGLLVEEAEGSWRAYGALHVNVLNTDAVPLTPDAVWEAALAYDPEAVGPFASVHYRERAEVGDTEAMYRLARLDDDETWFRKAADAGHKGACSELGRRLAERGETREAEPYLETAAGAGDAKAALELGKLLSDRAMHWLGVAADAEDPEAAHRLADLYVGMGEDDKAFNLYLAALDRGDEGVAGRLGVLHRYRGEELLARLLFRRAVDAGDTQRLAMLEGGGRSERVAEEYLRSRAADHGLDAVHLGVLLEERGHTRDAGFWYLHGLTLGDSYGAFRLAWLRAKEGKLDEARAWMRKAAEAGHPVAKKALAAEADGADTVEG